MGINFETISTAHNCLPLQMQTVFENLFVSTIKVKKKKFREKKY